MHAMPKRIRRRRRRPLAGAVITLAAVAAIALTSHQLDAGSTSAGTSDRGKSGRLLRWVDGDTAHVQINGRDVTVRLLGAGAPETHGTVQCGGLAATELAELLAPAGTHVRVITDSASGDVTDVYGRRLAYIDTSRGDVGAELIRRGRATVYRFHARRFSRLSRYERNDQAARAAHRGSWATCPSFSAGDDATHD